MGLSRVKLGDLIKLEDERNSDNKYILNDLKGVSIQKIFIETKADMQNVSLTPYMLVKPDFFVYVAVTSRNGEKITLAHNTSNQTYIVSSSYIVFSISRPDLLNSDFLFMYFNRPEFDRYSRFNSWGSARETFSWEDMCDMDIDLPSIDIQQKYVNIYKALQANQKTYERGLEDLKLVCDGYIEDLRRKLPCEEIGKYIRFCNEKNVDGKITLEQGINVDKVFISPQRPNSNLEGRRIVRRGQFAYCTQLNNENIAIAYRTGDDCVVSSVYDVFEIIDSQKLLPLYLMIWVIRREFGRYQYWASSGSSYEFLSYGEICNYKIPIPDIKVQQSIANIYSVYIKRKEINQKLKDQLKAVCPILVKGAMDEGRKEAAGR